MKISNNNSKVLTCLLYGIVSTLALVAVGGCGSHAQSELLTRPQHAGGEVVNPWLPTQERKFNELEKLFKEQIAHGEQLSPDSLEVRKLKSEYEKIKRLWQLQKQQKNSQLPDSFVNSVGIKMKLIQPGTFMMGNLSGKLRRGRFPVRKVIIEKSFYIGVYEVTEEQYALILGGNGISGPKTNVNWYEAIAFCEKLSEKERLTYTLPTEEQWEYACRAGTTTGFSFGDYWDEATSRQANSWGLYDMHGNVSEWCLNKFDFSTFGYRRPKKPFKGEFYTMRGSSWKDFRGGGSTASYRSYFIRPEFLGDSLGFRIVLLPD